MGFAELPAAVTKFDWKDLHKRIVRIAVAEANPECLEFTSQVFAMDLENGKTYVLAEIPFGKRKPVPPHPDEALWKQRFEMLVARIDDLKLEVRRGDFEKNEERAWDSCEVIYVSFCWDVVSEEAKAIELFGEGNYDTYYLGKRGVNGGPDEEPPS